MKKIKFIYMIIMVSIMQFSCKKLVKIDPPKTSLTQETVFRNNDQATAAMAGIYANLRSANFATESIGGLSFLTGMSGDELVCYNTIDMPFYLNQLSPDVVDVMGLYSGPYQTIYSANSILEGLAATTSVTPSVKIQLEGEALFVRAFANFYLVNLFGDVPLQLTSNYQVTSVASKESVQKVYQQIIVDLTLSESKLLDTYPTSGRVRPNKSVVQAMLARVYLYTQDWTNAEKYASLVIAKNGTYNLVDFNSIFLANSQEAIWQLEPVVSSNASVGTAFIPSSFTIPPPNASLQNSFVLNSFEAGDKRKDAWVKSYTIAASTYYYPFKYKVRTATIATEYSTVLRLAEQYLIRAESRINKGNISSGIGDLNIIRLRPLQTGGNANTLVLLPTTLNKDQALLAVEQERKIELFSEWGHRWFDLKRTGRATTVLSPIKSSWQSFDVLYPIPQNEVNTNRNITQNAGY